MGFFTMTLSSASFWTLLLFTFDERIRTADAFTTIHGRSSSSLPVFNPSSRLASTVQTVEDPRILDDKTTAVATTTTNDDENKNDLPGQDENKLFDCDSSVEFWQNFQTSGDASSLSNVRDMIDIASRFNAIGTSESLSYFARHMARSSYFITNALLGNVAFDLHERFVSNDSTTGAGEGGIFSNLSSDGATRLILEALICYEQDYEWVQRGTYKEPWDMTVGHRQSNPINVATQTGRFIRESIGVLARKKRATQNDKNVAFFGKENNIAVNDLYPTYYRNAFHFQTDGWMSSDSANVYETSTETLFLGRQDSMQRSSLPPIMKLAKKFEEQNGRPMRILEVACGTGRFMTFVRDNLPLDTEYTALDLSPFYLEKARDNDSYWRRQQQSSQQSDKKVAPARLVQGQAEQLPFDDESFDAVVCVYLFHELPRDVRRMVATEMARVAAPGGTVVFTDSVQRGDRPPLDSVIGNFDSFNEPYYRDYLSDDVAGHFIAVGLEPDTKIMRSTTKSLAFQKPGELQFHGQ